MVAELLKVFQFGQSTIKQVDLSVKRCVCRYLWLSEFLGDGIPPFEEKMQSVVVNWRGWWQENTGNGNVFLLAAPLKECLIIIF